jgi:hypothetical protein
LRGLERHCGFSSAFRADRASFRPYPAPRSGSSLDLALFAALGIVLELFVVEKKLLSRSENEVISAVDALQYFIEELHTRTLTLTGIYMFPIEKRCSTALASQRLNPV